MRSKPRLYLDMGRGHAALLRTILAFLAALAVSAQAGELEVRYIYGCTDSPKTRKDYLEMEAQLRFAESPGSTFVLDRIREDELEAIARPTIRPPAGCRAWSDKYQDRAEAAAKANAARYR